MTKYIFECVSRDDSRLESEVLSTEVCAVRTRRSPGAVACSVHLTRADALHLSALLAEFAMQGKVTET